MRHGRALLADSHLGLLGGLYCLLERLFDSVVMVADERSLLEAVTSFKPDLVVVDLSLPGEGGANLVKRLAESRPDLRLIVLSVYDEPSVVGQVMGSGVAGFVLKRAVATDLIPAVRAILAGGTYVSPAAQQARDRPKPGPGP
jgi:DNA-binding NarL/FixJ family response regulator